MFTSFIALQKHQDQSPALLPWLAAAGSPLWGTRRDSKVSQNVPVSYYRFRGGINGTKNRIQNADRLTAMALSGEPQSQNHI
jgi:hypothetical protein